MTTIHKFEQAGLGKAPYRFQGITENVFIAYPGATPKAGGACDYCATSIRNEYWLLSADGRKFKVGCDCISKAGDKGLLNQIAQDPKVRAEKLAKKRAKAQAVGDELSALIDHNAALLRSLPHPRGFIDRATNQPLTAYDDFSWLLKNCGDSGRQSTLRRLKTFLSAL